jgi:hypothetical protein
MSRPYFGSLLLSLEPRTSPIHPSAGNIYGVKQGFSIEQCYSSLISFIKLSLATITDLTNLFGSIHRYIQQQTFWPIPYRRLVIVLARQYLSSNNFLNIVHSIWYWKN